MANLVLKLGDWVQKIGECYKNNNIQCIISQKRTYLKINKYKPKFYTFDILENMPYLQQVQHS